MVAIEPVKALRAKRASVNQRKVLSRGEPMRKRGVRLKNACCTQREEPEQLELSPREFTAQRQKPNLQTLSTTNTGVAHRTLESRRKQKGQKFKVIHPLL